MNPINSETGKKRRFRPKKLVSKLFRVNSRKKDNGVSTTATMDSGSTYEPPSPEKITMVPLPLTTINASNFTETESTSSPVDSVISRSIDVVDFLASSESCATEARNGNRPGIMILQKEQSPALSSDFSDLLSDWKEFIGGMESAPFDEVSIMDKENYPFPFYAEASPDGDVEIDFMYHDDHHKLSDRVQPFEQPRSMSPAINDIEIDKTSTMHLNDSKEVKSNMEENLDWVELSDGTLEISVLDRSISNTYEEQISGSPTSTSGLSDAEKSCPECETSQHSTPFSEKVFDEIRCDAQDCDNQANSIIGTALPKAELSGSNFQSSSSMDLKVKSDRISTTKLHGKKSVLQRAQEYRAIGKRIQKKRLSLHPREQLKNTPSDSQLMDPHSNITHHSTFKQSPEKSIEILKINLKEIDDDCNPIVPVVPRFIAQKSRSELVLPTLSRQVDSRRIASLESNVTSRQPTHTLATSMQTLEPENPIEGPAPFSTDGLFTAVPEIGDEVNSLDGSFLEARNTCLAKVIETDEGTEVLSTFLSSYNSYQEEDSVFFSMNDTLCLGIEEEESDEQSNMSLDCDSKVDEDFGLNPVDSEIGKQWEENTDTDSKKLEVELLRSSNMDRDISEIDRFPSENMKSHLPGGNEHFGNDFNRPSENEIELQTTESIDPQPRRIMGRSLESVEAEQQHGSISPEKYKVEIYRDPTPLTPYGMSYDADDADDEMGAQSVVSTQTETSSFVGAPYRNDALSVTTEDESYDDDFYDIKTPFSRITGYISEESEDEEIESVINISTELSAMASEFRTKGPGVLMEWMDFS
jgi:hypothetical protein